MSRIRILSALAVALAVSACHVRSEDHGIELHDTSSIPKDVLAKAGVTHVDPKIMRLRAVAGQWASFEPGDHPQLMLNTAGDWQATMMHGRGPNASLLGMAVGKFVFDADGRISATSTSVDPKLADFSNWKAGFSSSVGGDMLVTDAKGVTIRYQRPMGRSMDSLREKARDARPSAPAGNAAGVVPHIDRR